MNVSATRASSQRGVEIFQKILRGKEYENSGNTSNLADYLKRFHEVSSHDNKELAILECTSNSFSSALTSTRSSNRSISSSFKISIEYESTVKRKKDFLSILLIILESEGLDPRCHS